MDEDKIEESRVRLDKAHYFGNVRRPLMLAEQDDLPNLDRLVELCGTYPLNYPVQKKWQKPVVRYPSAINADVR